MSPATEFAVSDRDSASFARLSGDYNPLHLDPVAARRTQFGNPVVHGIHLLLGTLDRTGPVWAAQRTQLASLSFVFNNPVYTGAKVQAQVTADPAGRRIRFTALSEGRTVLAAQAELDAATAGRRCVPEDAEIAATDPSATVFPPQTTAGSVPLFLARERLAALFPFLAQLGRNEWIADLLATTRIIGMQCPGAESIFSSGRLHRPEGTQPGPPPRSMSYQVARTDERFRMIRLTVVGGEFEGQLEALVRPSPVPQRSFSDIAASVGAATFKTQRALVIGGSRGLGELTAKILAAGGADVTITYSRGRDDAAKVQAQMRNSGATCSIEHLDLSREATLPEWLTRPFTHVYYFASPPIGKNTTGRWNQSLYEQLSDFYVRAFADIAHKMLHAGLESARPDRRFLYPSSVFLDTCEKGFAEYCVAKAAGEALCAQLQAQYGISFARPRLPRMRTDQTSSVPDASVTDSLPVMRDLLSRFCA